MMYLHGRLAGSALFFTFVVAVWALWLFLRGKPLNGSFLGAVVVGEGLLLAQSLIGVLLYFNAGMPQRWVHILYGLLAVLVWPFIYTYTRQAEGRVESLLFSAGSFFLWGILMRASSTVFFQ